MAADAPARRRRSTRRDPGDGAVFQRGDGRWLARLKLPDGHYRYLYGKSKPEVKARLAEAKRAVEDGRPVAAHRQSFGAYLEQWLAGLPSTNAKPATIAYYHRYVRLHVLPTEIARKPIGRLEPGDLRRLYADKLASGLSPTTVHHLHAVIHVALAQAVDDGKVARNVASLVGRKHRPKVQRRDMTTIADGDQPRRFLEALRGDPLEALFVLAISAGLRQGELRALRWRDVDLDRGVLAVTGSVHGLRRESLAIGTPKSGKARSVALGQVAVEALREHRRRQAEQQLLLGSEWQDRGLVFTNEWGDYISVNTMLRTLRRVLEQAGLPRIRFHDLRHTAATLLLSRGVHPKIASEMLGHSTVAITLDLYSHVTSNMQRDAAATIDQVLGGDRQP